MAPYGKDLLFLFSSSETHIGNQVAFLKSTPGNWHPVFVVRNAREQHAVKYFWDYFHAGSDESSPTVVRSHMGVRIARAIAYKLANLFGRPAPHPFDKALLRRIGAILGASCGGFAWSHGDPTSPTFPALVGFFGPSVPLYLVDDGSASRYVIRTRSGESHEGHPETLNPNSEAFLLSRTRIHQIIFVTIYVDEKIGGLDKIVKAPISRIDLRPSRGIWLTGSPIGGREYVDFIMLALDQLTIPRDCVLYLPHPKESRSRLRQIENQVGLSVPKDYRRFELFVEAHKVSPERLITLPSTVIELAVALGINPEKVTLLLPSLDWLPYPTAYARFVSDLQATHPEIETVPIPFGDGFGGPRRLTRRGPVFCDGKCPAWWMERARSAKQPKTR